MQLKYSFYLELSCIPNQVRKSSTSSLLTCLNVGVHYTFFLVNFYTNQALYLVADK